MANLEGKVTLVTGGTTGIGRAISVELARQGAKVLIFGRHKGPLDEALKAIADVDGEAEGIVADQSSPEDVEKVFAKASAMGELAAVIANAGVAAEGLAETSDKEWRAAMDINLLGYLDVSKRAIEAFGDRKGDIILVGSVSADNRSKGTSVYAATKAGVQAFADTFRKEVGDRNIRVSLIEPGAVGSDMQDASPKEQREKIAEGKMLKAEDVAELVTFILTRPHRCVISAVRIEERVQS